jgi:hypothetical protein
VNVFIVAKAERRTIQTNDARRSAADDFEMGAAEESQLLQPSDVFVRAN